MTVSRVLVVEDAVELSRLLQLTFTLDDRFEPLGIAADAPTALSMAEQLQPDAIVLDVSIEGAAQTAMVRQLRARAPRTRIVVFTGHDDSRRREQALRDGASAYVVKGGDLDQLLDALDDALADGTAELDERSADRSS